MSDGVLITARLKSKRFPKKIIKKLINGNLIIEHLIKNLKKKFEANQIILITSKSRQDHILTKIAKKNGISFYRGHAKDVLERMLKAVLIFLNRMSFLASSRLLINSTSN